MFPETSVCLTLVWYEEKFPWNLRIHHSTVGNPLLLHWNIPYAVTHLKTTSTTLRSFREPMKTHYSLIPYSMRDTCDTHSAHFYSCESAVAAPLFSPPPSLSAFVQCYTAKEHTKTLTLCILIRFNHAREILPLHTLPLLVTDKYVYS